jgi:hypothetical protein
LIEEVLIEPPGEAVGTGGEVELSEKFGGHDFLTADYADFIF